MSKKVKTQFETRCDQLFALGLRFDFNRNMDGGNYVYHGGINFHWTDITCMSTQDWTATVEKVTAHKAKIDEKLKLLVDESIKNNTLPLLNLGEKPENLVIDATGISYINSIGGEIICTPDGKLWLDKIHINNELSYETVLTNAKKFV